MADLLARLSTHPLLTEPWGDFGPIEVLDWRANEHGTPRFAGVLNHHTVSNARSGRYPSKSICQNGRGGSHPVPGPLCNILGARGGGSVAVISRQVANHAGTGDPDVLRRVRAGVPPKARPAGDQRNAGGGAGFVGIEWENDGTGEPWSARMVDTIVRVNAALCDIFGWDPAVACLGHLEWTRRKIDPAFLTPRMDMGDLRRMVAETLAAWRGGQNPTPQEDVMNADQEKKLDDLAAKVAALEEKLDTLSGNLDVLAVGGHYQGHPTEGAVPLLTKLHRHLAGEQLDDGRPLRKIVEAIRNRVGD